MKISPDTGYNSDNRIIMLQNALAGSVVAFTLVGWIMVGSITVKGKHPRLPPISVTGCDVQINGTLAPIYAPTQ